MAITSFHDGSGPPPQPMIRYLFLDLDPLLSAVNTHVAAQPTVYSQELVRMSADGVMLDVARFTALLDDQEQQQPPTLVLCRYGSYFNCSLENARALQAVGWDLKKKGAIDHRTLENLMERNLEHVGACSAGTTPKTMVLVTGELRPPSHSCIQAYMQSGWRVKLFCLQRSWSQTLDDLGRAYPGRFTVVYLDQHLTGVLLNKLPPAKPTSPQPGASLLSRIATNGELWGQVSVRRGSALNSTPRARALAPAAATPKTPPGPSQQNLTHMNHMKYTSANTCEENAAEHRRKWLSIQEKVYTPGNRQRYVFMNLDNITGALFTSHKLYRHVDGATNSRDVRLNFRTLTKHLCGVNTLGLVKSQVAVYCKTNPVLVHVLREFGWTLKPMAGDEDKVLQYEMMLRLIEGASTTSEKTLVLALGDTGFGSRSNTKPTYREIICKFLEQHWYMEVHGWLHALNEEFLELQVQYPGRVIVKPLDEHISDLVYLKQQENMNAVSALIAPVNASANASTATTRLQKSFTAEFASIVNRPCETSKMPATTFDRWSALRQVSPPLPPSSPQPTVASLQQQLLQMQHAFTTLQTSVSTQKQLQEQNDEMEKAMREQAEAFDDERKRQAALSAQQVNDARLARRLQLEEREESLTCPITCELYKEPVTTVCCGKTFSGEVVGQVNECCPWCREVNFFSHPNRDIAELVEQYRAERDAFEAEEHCDENNDEKEEHEDEQKNGKGAATP